MKTIALSRLLLVILILVSASLVVAQNDQTTHNSKYNLYIQIMNDPNILRLVDEIRRDPRNNAKIDTLLIQLPLSPLDLFQIRMESNRYEYIIPKQVFEWHEKWLLFHRQLAATTQALQALLLNSQLAPLAAVMTNRNVAATDNPAPMDYQGEVQVSVNRNNANQIVAGANTWDLPGGCDQTQAIFSSSDGGSTWNYTCAPSVGDYGLSCPDDGIPFGSDPAVFWDNNNKVFMNYLLLCCDIFCQFGFTYPGTSLAVARSDNGGTSWVGHGIVVDHLSGTGGLDDKEFYIIDNNPSSPHYGRHYECWDNDNNELLAYSDNGINWTIKDPPSAGSGLFDIGCEMAIASNGTVHLVWDALTCGTNSCSGESTYYTRSTDGGATWSAPVLVKTHHVVAFNNNSKIPAQNSRGINPFGAIDVDNSSAHPGRLYVANSDVNSGASMGTSDIYVSRSDDGVTWTSVKVNDDGTSTAQFHPFLMVDQTNGNVNVGWHDTRNDTTNKRKVDYYMSRSTNGGVTWEANTKVSQPSSEFNNTGISYSDENTNDNSAANPNQYGEYLGVDALNNKVYMAWTDSRHYFPNDNGNGQNENIGFAVVEFSSDNIAPITTITSPLGGATVNGTTTINADASDNIGVTKVEFYVDTTLIGTDTNSPYSINWNTMTTSNGTHNLTTKAYDAANNIGTSPAVNVTVNNPDTTPPTTSITSPTGGSTVSGTIPIKANATDNVKVKKVEFYVDGTILIGSDATTPYQVNWNTNSVLNGSHNLNSKAYDTSNNTSTSATVNVNVSNPNSCSLTNQIVNNPGFESGSTGWNKSSTTGDTSTIITNSTIRAPHSGSWYAKLNGLGTANTQSIITNSTTMVIAAEACAVSLSFWLSIDTAEITTTNAFDTIVVQIQTKNPNGTWGPFTTLATYSNLDATGVNVYVQKSLDLLTYKGKTVKIRFQGKENPSLQTTFLIDDTAVNVTQ